MLIFAQFGAGRIGSIHAANLAASGRARLAHVVDVHEAAAASFAARHGALASDPVTALRDPKVGAVIIASSLNHFRISACRSGLPNYPLNPICV